MTCGTGSSAITCPTLVGSGNYDGIAPAPNSTNIASRIRGAELYGYEGGHGFVPCPGRLRISPHSSAAIRKDEDEQKPLSADLGQPPGAEAFGAPV